MMTATASCATGTIQPLNQSLTARQVQHLSRRVGFSLSYSDVQKYTGYNSSNLVDEIINRALDLPLTPPPKWADWTWEELEVAFQNEEEDFDPYSEMTATWLTEMLENGFRERVALFWSNHFVTEFEQYEYPPFLYKYHILLQKHALGNFKDFVYDIGINPAMLTYLNGFENFVDDPNENYARELLELFTLGLNNGYTEKDIQEVARALTGWQYDWEFGHTVFFNEDDHDVEEKTIFGQTGEWGYDDVVDLLFEYRANEIANFICRKIYSEFVSEDIDEKIVEALSRTFLDNDFELEPVFRQLLKSEHFFDEAFIGTRVKSPVEALLNYITELELPVLQIMEYKDEETDEVYRYRLIDEFPWLTATWGQIIYSPPNVGGWKGHNFWLDNTKLYLRWQNMRWFHWVFEDGNEEQGMGQLRDWARMIAQESTDPLVISERIIGHFTPNGFHTKSFLDAAAKRFRYEIPSHYFENGYWTWDWEEAPYQVAVLLEFIVIQPEFQLC